MIRRKSREDAPPAFPKENSPWEEYERYFKAKSEWNIRTSKKMIEPIGFCETCGCVTKTKVAHIAHICEGGESFWACTHCGSRAHCAWCKSVDSGQVPVPSFASWVVPSTEGLLTCIRCKHKFQGRAPSSRLILLLFFAIAACLTTVILLF